MARSGGHGGSAPPGAAVKTQVSSAAAKTISAVLRARKTSRPIARPVRRSTPGARNFGARAPRRAARRSRLWRPRS